MINPAMLAAKTSTTLPAMVAAAHAAMNARDAIEFCDNGAAWRAAHAKGAELFTAAHLERTRLQELAAKIDRMDWRHTDDATLITFVTTGVYAWTVA